VRLLLDTHVLLWWVSADRRLSTETRDLIAATDNEVAVSAASFWEIAIKISLRRIEIDLQQLLTVVKADGFEELPVRAAHTVLLPSLPPLHNDPFDRLLIAQAIAEGHKLVTRDAAILGYTAVEGFNPLPA
jgi:PIN domain nuclease of toxin-antitoxin system